jgi:hypothetical protein
MLANLGCPYILVNSILPFRRLSEAFPNREDILTLASVPVPLLDSTTQVCWKSDNPSPPDTTANSIPCNTQQAGE